MLYFDAGLPGATNGLLGAISSVPEPSSIVLSFIAIGVVTGGWHGPDAGRVRLPDRSVRSFGTSGFWLGVMQAPQKPDVVCAFLRLLLLRIVLRFAGLVSRGTSAFGGAAYITLR